jgi:hypothetical protein
MFHPRNNISLARRHGSAYVLVLGIALIVTVLGMGALTASRVQTRMISAAANWEESGTLASAAVEQALSYINAAAAASPATWRSAFTNRQIAFTQPLGDGMFSWALKDETDGNLSASYLRPIRIYGIGQVGSVTRVYSVLVTPTGAPLDVLRTAVHAGGNVTLTGKVNAVNGPISSNANVSLSGTVNAAVEAASVSGNTNGNETQTVPAAAKLMPPSAIYGQYAGTATSIPWSSLDNDIQPLLLSSTYNPYGTPDPNGLYSIVLPNNTDFQISNSRICGTLLISGSNATITFGPLLWEPARPDYPILIISGSNCTINFQGSNNWISESALHFNMNPAGTPFEGASDADQLDDYPPQYRGLIHVIGSTNTVQLNANSYFVGTLIADGTIMTTGSCTAIQNPSIYVNPPIGYTTGNQMVIVPGSWRWDTLP